MTWKEWKEAIESLGVKDDDKVAYIDAHGWPEAEHLHKRMTHDGKDYYWEIA